MLIRDMGVQECREVLSRVGFGRLACVRNELPYVVPIYFAYEPDCLYGFSAVGQKIEWMRSNPHVCVEVDEVASHFRWKSVIVTGRYEELSETGKCTAELSKAHHLIEKRYLWWQAAYAADQFRHSHDADSSPLFYCIHIGEMTGRSAAPDPIEIGVPL
jgi:hypothetical protein